MKQLLLAIFLLISTSSFSQKIWEKELYYNSIFYTVTDYDSGFFLLSSKQHIQQTGYLTKCGKDGEETWTKSLRINGYQSVVPEMLAETPGGYYIAGSACKDSVNCGIIVSKVNYCFEEEWSRFIPVTTNNPWVTNVISPLPDSGLILPFYYGSDKLFHVTNFITRLDKYGNLLWAYPTFNLPNDIKVYESSNEILISGPVYIPVPDSASATLRAFSLNLDLKTGIKNWYHILDNTNNNISDCWGGVKYSDTFYYNVITDRNQPRGYGRLIKYDPLGKIQLNKVIGDSTKAEYPIGLFKLNNGNMLVPFIQETNKSSHDYKTKILLLDKNGNTVKEKLVGNNDTFYNPSRFYKGMDGRFVCFAYRNFNGSSTLRAVAFILNENLELSYFSDYPLPKLDYKCSKDIVSDDSVFLHPDTLYINTDTVITEPYTEFILSIYYGKDFQFNIKFYPNPAGDYLLVDVNASNTSIAISDVCGRLIKQFILTENNIDISFLPSGVYFFTAMQNGNILGTQKILKQ